MYAPCQIVVASSSLERRRELMSILVNLGLDPICASSVASCRELIGNENIELVFSDRSFLDGDYRDILACSFSSKSKPNLVLVCSHELDEYREAMDLGVVHVIGVPCRPTDVEWMVIQAKRRRRDQVQAPAPKPVAPEKALRARAG